MIIYKSKTMNPEFGSSSAAKGHKGVNAQQSEFYPSRIVNSVARRSGRAKHVKFATGIGGVSRVHCA